MIEIADLEKLENWLVEFMELANKGDPEAMETVATAYEYGAGGVEKSKKKAQEWYAKRIPILLERANNDDLDAMEEVAWAYLHGEGVEGDLKKAKYWYVRAKKARAL